MTIIRIFDANASTSLNLITKILMELQLSDFLKEVTSSATSSNDTKEDVAA